MTELLANVGAEQLKSCCAGLYESDMASLLLRESLHPGGLALTGRLGRLLNLGPNDQLLDVAAGKGTSAIFLAQHFGCRVVGLDFGSKNVAKANAAAERAGISDRVRFDLGDAERLPFEANQFDAVICECSFCTFPDKPAAAAEFARVLRRGGRVGISDLTRMGPLPGELQNLLAWIACLADSQPVEQYITLLETAGIEIHMVEPHAEALSKLVREVRTRLLAAELVLKLNKLDPPEIDFEQAKSLARAAEASIKRGTIGYALIIGAKPVY